MKKIKNKKTFIFNLLLFLGIIIYAIFNSDILNDLDKNKAFVSNVNTTSKVDFSSNDNLKVYFIDVGQADSILIRVGNNNVLIDAGNNDDGKLLVNYFKELGIEKFNYVIATHPLEDHIGGMDDVINNFKIDNYFMSDRITTTKTFEDVLDALEENNIKYVNPSTGTTFDVNDANFKIIYSGLITGDINDSSIVLKITYGNTSFLFMADATSNVEKLILNNDIKSDVLKVGHHGSNYSSTSDFLKKVEPKYAVISVGKNNIYKHPSNETINKLKSMKVKLYRTDLNGTIICNSDGNNLEFEMVNTNTNG